MQSGSNEDSTTSVAGHGGNFDNPALDQPHQHLQKHRTSHVSVQPVQHVESDHQQRQQLDNHNNQSGSSHDRNYPVLAASTGDASQGRPGAGRTPGVSSLQPGSSKLLPYTPSLMGSFNQPIVEEESIYAVNHNGQTVKAMRITIFCPGHSLSKQYYFDKWKQLEQGFLCDLGNVFFENEVSLMQRLQSYNIMGTAFRQSGNRSLFYFSGHTLENVLILMEIIIDHSSENAGLVRYKVCDECKDRDAIFEAFIRELLSSEWPQLHVLAERYADRLCLNG